MNALLAIAARRLGYRNRRVGGIRFMALGRLRVSFCVAAPNRMMSDATPR